MGLLCRILGHKYNEQGYCPRCGTSRGSEGLKLKRTADKQGYTVVSAGKCRDEQVIIPRTYRKKPVVALAERAFFEYDVPFEISLPDTIVAIGDAAFGCSALRRVHFSDTPCALGKAVFGQCAALEQASLPTGLDKLPMGTFLECTALVSVDLPDSIRVIGAHAFAQCTALTSVTFSDEVEKIGASAFAGCDKLAAIRLPRGLTELGSHVLCGCSSLTALDIPESVRALGDHALDGCSGLCEIRLPEGLVSIGSAALRGCTGIESLTLPASLCEFRPNKAGEGDLFRGCSALKELNIHPHLKHFPAGTVADCPLLVDIHLNGKSLDWRGIQKDEGWDEGSGSYIVHLANGKIRKGC